MTGLLIRGAEVGSRTGVDVRIIGDRIVEIGQGLKARSERLVDADSGSVIPGLHDHHVHLLSLAAALASVRCGPPEVSSADELTAALRAGARRASPGEWVRGYGYHESVAGALDRSRLDEMVRDHPVRIQHRTGTLWILNSAALAATGADEEPPPRSERDSDGRLNGRLIREDRWLAARGGEIPTDLAAVGQLLSSFGVTSVTDATPDLEANALAHIEGARLSGDLPQRVLSLGAPSASATVQAGPLKLVIDEWSGIDLDGLTARVAASHLAGRPVALHCVTAVEVVAAVASLEAAGGLHGDRLEHASVTPAGTIVRMRDLGVTVVTQPNFIAERGDSYLDAVQADELGALYRCNGLIAAGVAVAAGTDAPFGQADPWAAMRAAIDRRSASGRVIGAGERISPDAALRLFLGNAEDPGRIKRSIEPGTTADLCLLARPLADVLKTPTSDNVRLTVIGGKVVFER